MHARLAVLYIGMCKQHSNRCIVSHHVTLHWCFQDGLEARLGEPIHNNLYAVHYTVSVLPEQAIPEPQCT